MMCKADFFGRFSWQPVFGLLNPSQILIRRSPMSIITAHHPHKPLSIRQITGGLLGYERCPSKNQGSRAVC